MMLYLKKAFLNLTRTKKGLILILADSFFTLLALWLAFSLRFGEFYQPEKAVWTAFIAAPVIAIPIFIRLGLYRAIIRYIGLQALATIVMTVSVYSLIFSAILFYLNTPEVVIPRTVPVIYGMLLLLLIGLSRFWAKWWLGDDYRRLATKYDKREKCRQNVIIYGAGHAGIQLADALVHGIEFKAVAFVDDNSQLHQHKINYLKVYSSDFLGELIERYQVTHILLAIPSVSRSRRNQIIHLLEAYSLHIRTIPSINEIADGKITFNTLQEVDIADLLGRDSVPANQTLLAANIYHKVVMVTGAGGSIGSELCRQIIQQQPLALILFERAEFQLYQIEKSLNQLTKIKIIPILASITNQKRVLDVYAAFKVQTVYHAAAYKHVPLVEQNPAEAVWNNIFGTLTLAQAAMTQKVETFVLISTDKAVRPTNTMGASKRFAELILQALSQEEQNQHTRFTMVRFGNVLGSSGSVVPLFREQIAKGVAVTVTDERIIRYFMTIPEAAELVIQAGAMGKGGDVFVLDMGEPVKIVDLARRMIRLSGFEVKDAQNPDGDIEIRYIGLRAGEKLYEELLIGDNVSKTAHEKIKRAQENVIAWEDLSLILDNLRQATEENDFENVRQILKDSVAGFKPQCQVADEVSLAYRRKIAS